ncbi:MAG: Fe-S protein assembly co-chaperone HscB [Planctomycetota bacterium]|nr:Fe-S protein assembly co-chaperone HscB [Planctomycetota bacterium]MDA1113212.1 Fe-S protein assembly co-chaperone HscB [Planctomycetota bacterium]
MLDPFQLLNLPRGFDLDDCVLRGALIKASLQWHPDRFALGTEEQRDKAEDHMADLNEAFAMLSSPLQRAETLLALSGFALNEGTDQTSSAAFLMRMMELKEEADDALKSDDVVRIGEMRRRIQEDIAHRVEQLRDSFRAWKAADYCPGTLTPLRALLTEAVYLQRTLDGLQITTMFQS